MDEPTPLTDAPLDAGHAVAAPQVSDRRVMPRVGRAAPASGLRIYSAILGHEPTVDADAPDVIHRRRWTDLAGELRERATLDYLAAQVQAARAQAQSGSWRHVYQHAVAATATATRRIDEARRRFRDRAA